MSSNTQNILGSLPVAPKGTAHRVPATPRKHKTPVSNRLVGVSDLKETLVQVKSRVKERLQLKWSLDDWQEEMIRRVRKGYDGILVAGTGYGKSIIFEGLAALNKDKIVIVISPLKALDRDQVKEAEKKKLAAAMVNEDTVSIACGQNPGIQDVHDLLKRAVFEPNLQSGVVYTVVAFLECYLPHPGPNKHVMQMWDTFGKAPVPCFENSFWTEFRGAIVFHEHPDPLFYLRDGAFEEEKEEIPNGQIEKDEE
ncbi:hypothetical protein DFH09DRAFT_1095715 [Mycena vulgaris]|nr:hypothetical protein DFH09DRAFT_1095715 [Mycena vulgaris]